MSLKLVDAGCSQRLTECRTNWNATPLHMHLFKNNYTPLTTTVLANLTECDFPGYAVQNIVTWGAPSVAAHIASMVAAANTFTRSTTGAGQAIYGCFVTLADNVTLLWAERDPVADSTGVQSVTNAGDSYSATAKQTSQDLST